MDGNDSIHIYLGISWKQNENIGAWGCVFHYRRHYRAIGGIQNGGTANGLHILSAISSLSELKRPLPVQMYTTSGYLRDGIHRWLAGWQQRGWITSDGREVSNRELWKQLPTLLTTFQVTVHLADKKSPPCHLQEAKELSREYLAGLN